MEQLIILRHTSQVHAKRYRQVYGDVHLIFILLVAELREAIPILHQISLQLLPHSFTSLMRQAIFFFLFLLVLLSVLLLRNDPVNGQCGSQALEIQ